MLLNFFFVQKNPLVQFTIYYNPLLNFVQYNIMSNLNFIKILYYINISNTSFKSCTSVIIFLKYILKGEPIYEFKDFNDQY